MHAFPPVSPALEFREPPFLLSHTRLYVSLIALILPVAENPRSLVSRRLSFAAASAPLLCCYFPAQSRSEKPAVGEKNLWLLVLLTSTFSSAARAPVARVSVDSFQIFFSYQFS